MRNGDRLTCEIKTLNAGSLDVKLDYVDGTISVEWSEVERLDSKRLFLVTLDDGTVFSGRLSIVETPPDAPVQLKITTESGDYAVIEKPTSSRCSRPRTSSGSDLPWTSMPVSSTARATSRPSTT